MARANPVRQTFLGGEFSPRCWGRTDLPQFPHGHKLLENWTVLPQGPISRRTGYRHVRGTTGNLAARLIPFTFSEEESFQLEICKSSDGVVASTLAILDAYNPLLEYTATNSLPAYLEEHLPQIQYAQSGDVLWAVHGEYRPMLINRRKGDWYVDDGINPPLGLAVFENILVDTQPWRDQNTTATTLDPSATSGVITLTASTAGFFEPGMEGVYYKLNQLVGSQYITGLVRLTGYVSDTVYNAEVIINLQNTNATDDWEESAWSDYRGWPRTVGLFESRVYYGGNKSEPDKVWASASQNFFNMDARGFNSGSGFPAQTNASPFSFTPSAGQVNKIQWIAPGKTLPVGSLGQEFIGIGPDQNQSLGPQNISFPAETAHGSYYAQAARVAYAVNFITRSGKKIRELVFDFNSDSYQATDIALLSEHMLKNRIVQLEWQESPNGILWMIDKRGKLIGCTRERQQQIAAWHKVRFGGRLDDGSGLGVFVEPACTSISIAPIEDGQDRIFAVVKRTINGSDVYYIEYQEQEFDADRDFLALEECCYMDSFKVATAGGGGSTVFSGFDHLKGETVKVVAAVVGGTSPNYMGEVVVSNTGTITISKEAGKIIAGLGYRSKEHSLPTETPSAIGSSQGLMKRMDTILLRLMNTYGLQYGSPLYPLQQINFANPKYPGHVALFTGDKRVEFPNGWDEEGEIALESDWPFPCTVNFVATRMVVNEV